MIRAAAINMPGRLLSQPANVTSASRRSACITHSTESAMISRDTSEPRMPSWPIEMPSETAIVTNSIGKPPASRTPSLARLASRSSGMLQGVTSFQLDATPTCALPQSPSFMPIARSMARAGRPLHAVGHFVASLVVLQVACIARVRIPGLLVGHDAKGSVGPVASPCE